ncbi:fem-1, partial [Pristionchus pacificus]
LDVCLNIRDGSTDKIALVIACRNGHLDAAKLLFALGADPRICGTVSFDGETIQGAPPLWAASAAGHMELVRFLVEEAGVDINQTTQTSSSPLRGACYDGHLEIVRYLVEKGADMELANRHGHTPLMIGAFRKKSQVVEYLLSKGASPLKSSYKGNTALHDAAESDCIVVCKLLIEAGASLVEDDCGLCPLMGAAVMANMAVFPFLVAHSVSKRRIKDAYRLLGCTLVDKKMDLEGAVKMWNSAIDIQLNDEEMEMERTRRMDGASHHVFKAFPEVITKDQLELIKDDPDKIRMQALVVRERILGGAHSDVHYFLRLRGAVYCDMGDVNRCFDLWMYALELQQIHLGPLHVSTLATLQAFHETFSIALNEVIMEAVGRQIGEDSFPISFNQISSVFSKVCIELERLYEWGDSPIHEDCSVEGHDYDIEEEKRKVAHIGLQLIILADRLRTATLSFGWKDTTYPYLDVNRFVRGALKLKIHLLHLASYENGRDPSSHSHAMDDVHFPSTHCIDSLLKAGMNPQDKDEDGRTALHIIVSNKKVKTSIVSLLLDAGASLYMRDQVNMTSLEIMKRKDDNQHMFKNIKIGKYTCLQDLAALAIKRHGIQYKEVIPLDVISFISQY